MILIHNQRTMNGKQIIFPLIKTIEDIFGIQTDTLYLNTTQTTHCKYYDENGNCYRPVCDKKLCKYHLEFLQEKQIDEYQHQNTTNKKHKITAQELLNSLIIQKKTKLYRTEHGLFEPQTELLFNENFEVIGKLMKDQVVKLNSLDTRKCDTFGYVYSNDIVEESEIDTFDRRQIHSDNFDLDDDDDDDDGDNG